MKIIHLLILTICFVFSIFAQDDSEKDLMQGREKEVYREGKINTNNCLVYQKYVVKTIINGEAGETVNVFNRTNTADAKGSCQITDKPIISLANNYSGKGGLESEEMMSYFYGISGKYLFITKDVEPFLSAFEVFDLTNGKSIYKAEYYPSLKLLQNRLVFFENWAEKDGLVKNCKEAKKWKKQGLGIGWVNKFQFDLQTKKVTKLGLRCEATQ